MKVSSCGDNIKYITEDYKRIVCSKCGNVQIEFIKELLIYRISKTDGTIFNGHEYLLTENDEERYHSIEYIVDQLINMFTYFQNDIESIMFEKYFYHFSESKKSIIIEPVYEKTEGIEMYVPDGMFEEKRLVKHKVGIKN